VSQYQKGKTNLDFIVARAVSGRGGGVSMGHMPVCTSLQTDNHASTLPLGFFRQDALTNADTRSQHSRNPQKRVTAVTKAVTSVL